MTREECLLKLLALEPETRAGILAATGWPIEDVDQALASLQAQGRIRVTGGWNHRQYFVPHTAQARIVRLARRAEASRQHMRARRALAAT